MIRNYQFCLLIKLFTITFYLIACSKTKHAPSEDDMSINDTSGFNRIYLSDDSLIAIYKNVQPKFVGYIYKLGNEYQISIHERFGQKRRAYRGDILPIDISKKRIKEIQKNGPYLEYNLDGRLSSVTNYKANLLEGTMIILDTNGIIENAYFMRDDSISNVYTIELTPK